MSMKGKMEIIPYISDPHSKTSKSQTKLNETNLFEVVLLPPIKKHAIVWNTSCSGESKKQSDDLNKTLERK